MIRIPEIGSSALLASLMRFHVPSENDIDTVLITPPSRFEEFNHVRVEPQGNLLLLAWLQLGFRKEIISELGNIGKIDIAVLHGLNL